MRTTTCRSSWLVTLVAGAALAPAAALAQTPATSTGAAAPHAAAAADSTRHVVSRGETLWALASRYLADPFRWPALHELNRDVVENPHWIYPGERLRLPGDAPADASAVAPEPPPGPTVFTRVESPAIVGAASVQAGGEPTARRGEGLLQADSLRALRRLADYTAAPYLADGRLAGAGRMVQLPTRLTASSVGDDWVQLGSEVRLEVPAGVTAAVGQRYVVYELVHDLGREHPIVQPTGLVEVTALDAPLVRGRVIEVLGALASGQRLMPLATPGAARGGTASGAATRVIWVQDEAVLPSIQDWVLLAPPAGGALAEGDEVEFVRHYRPDGDDRGPELEEVVGRARVVRVTPGAASAMITHVIKPVIQVGLGGRVAAGRN